MVELWLGPAGAGKTSRALATLCEELKRDWRGVRYLVPTVNHKRSIEHLLLQHAEHTGLFGDPITTFFNFAQEVAQRAQVNGRAISELQKHLMLKGLVRNATLSHFARAARFPGFVDALRESIDELKVSMIRPEELLAVAESAVAQEAAGFGQKIHELGTLYAGYQTQVWQQNLYDNEGIMWIAAERLRERPELFADLHCLILDGFARLTPIQIDFLGALAPCVPHIIVLFDYVEQRAAAYHPVQVSLQQLEELERRGEITLYRKSQPRPNTNAKSTLNTLCDRVFNAPSRQMACCDDSVVLLIGATPSHEIELIAREVRNLLQRGALPDGTRVTPDDIAILARNADAIRERFARTFQRFGLAIRRDPPLLAHTPVGRALLAAFRLVRDRWKREDILTLLKSGFLAVDPTVAFEIDVTARTHYLRERKSTWFERWPQDETRQALAQALAPLDAFDAVFQHERDATALLQSVAVLLQHFHRCAMPEIPPLPDIDLAAAQRYAALNAAFTKCEAVLDELFDFGNLQGGFRREEALDIITTALLRETVANPVHPDEGIPVLPVHATGGEKFKIVFLCGLLEGIFPHHQRESAFFMDHERADALTTLELRLDPRRDLEEDERYWFLHALSSANKRLVMSYPCHDADGNPLERSSFLDEVETIFPDLPKQARTTSFREVTPPLSQTGNVEEYLASLTLGLRTARDAAAQTEVAAGYAGCPQAQGPSSALATIFRDAAGKTARLASPAALSQLAMRQRPFSSSELQGYLDCPFLWFGQSCLGIAPIVEEFSPLDRGTILHTVLEKLYRSHQRHPGEPVHLERYTVDELWPEVEANLHEGLHQESRFANRPQFLREIEWGVLCRMMKRFLRNEIERARTRRLHPAYFEQAFGFGNQNPLALGSGTLLLHGLIDRIDLADDDPRQAVVVDYKSSTAMSLKDLAQGKVLQAPVYALALERLFHLTALGTEFMGLKRGECKGVYRDVAAAHYEAPSGMKLLDEEHWHGLLSECEQRLCDAARALRSGDIALTPTTTRCPDKCEYLPLCQGDRFALARQVRANAALSQGKQEEMVAC